MPKILTPEQRETSRLRRRQRETERQRCARAADPDRYRLVAKASRDRHRPELRARKKQRWAHDPEYRRKQQARRARWLQHLRQEVFLAYGGPICRCCGEEHEELLCLDHIEGGGNAHRREIGQASLPQWLKAHGFPPGFRVLCFNCNNVWAQRGYCPHEVELDDVVERMVI